MFGIVLIKKSELQELRAKAELAASTVLPFWQAEADKAVAILKQTEIGDAVADSIKAIKDAEMSGLEKFQAVVGEIAPLLLDYVSKGGIPAVIDDVEDVARQLVQSVYNDVMSTKAGSVIKAILKVFGL